MIHRVALDSIQFVSADRAATRLRRKGSPATPPGKNLFSKAWGIAASSRATIGRTYEEAKKKPRIHYKSA
jgi:hypothetical protein